MKKLFFFLLCLVVTGTTTLNAQTSCNAAFGWQANPNGNSLLNIDFTNNSTSSAPPSVNTYSYCTINYGDGSGFDGFGTTSSHNYASAGTYTVTVIINTYDSSSAGITNICTDTGTGVVTINSSPCASTVASQSNGSGSYTFTANNPAGTSGMTYSWDFGDNTSGSGNPVTHTYSTPGYFTVTLTSTGGGCTYTNATTIYSNVMPAFNCSSATADFSSSVTNSDVYFSNLSTGNQGNYDVNITGAWDFGDGNTATTSTWGPNTSHNYAAIGTYIVSLVNTWTDSASNQVICTKTAYDTVTITTLSPPPSPQNIISGIITFDSLNNNIQWSDSIKVWLITHDTAANTLTAVDSQYIYAYYAFYSFDNEPAGNYLVKAAYLNQTAGSAGLLPTYHLASVYWNSATNISHTGGTSSGKDIHLQNGTVTSGPGFIGGNISAGAGKGTGTGVRGMLVYLRGSNNQLISSTVTDADGDFSFSDIAIGAYSVYPEAINYNTTPFNTINVTSSQPHVEAIDFEQTETEIKPKNTTGIAKISEKDGLKIYPNPAKDMVTIDNQNGLFNHINILNTVGQSVKEINLKNGINKVDVSEMNAGIYYLLIGGNDGSRSMKFVKQ